MPFKSFQQIVAYWRDTWDWRSYEDHLNSFRHFQVPVAVSGFDPLNVHFLHHRSSRVDAQPLLFVHGWPGSFLESLKLIPLLTEPKDPSVPAFHVVAPSIPGYGFSDACKKSGFGLDQIAECFTKLMGIVGYDKFVCQVSTKATVRSMRRG